jgi:hypothetical protein
MLISSGCYSNHRIAVFYTPCIANFPTKGLRSKRRISPYIFQVVATNDSFVIIGTTYTQTKTKLKLNINYCIKLKLNY